MSEKADGAFAAREQVTQDPVATLRSALARKFASGAALEVLAAGAGLAVRLGSNLVLTRLLFPEAFGLSAMVVTVIHGLIMLSDVGLAQSVMQSPRGEDASFLRTAWTAQFLRGLALWFAASLLAWPTALLLKEPQVLWLMPCGAFSLAINGLTSMRTLLLRRELRIAPLMLLEIAGQLVGVAATILTAYLGWGVWSLVVGAISSSVIHAGGSYVLPGRHRDGFGWEAAARREIVQFGRWILASSALTFAVMRGDQLLLARLLGAASLGYYNLALAISDAFEALAARVAGGVIYPLFAQLHNQSPEALRRVYYRARLGFDGVAQTALGGLFALSAWLIDLLYDDRYQAASPMLQVLVVRAGLTLLAAPCEMALTAQGLSAYGFRRNVAVAISLIVLMPGGYALGGAIGLLWGTVLGRSAGLLVLWPAASERGLLRIPRELLAAVFFGAGVLLGELLLLVLPEV